MPHGVFTARTRSRGTNDGVLLEQIVDGLDGRGVPEDAKAGFLIGGSKPVELVGFELGLLVADQVFKGNLAANNGKVGAILFEGVVDGIGETEPTGTGIILGMMRGFPGMWRLICRATVRA